MRSRTRKSQKFTDSDRLARGRRQSQQGGVETPRGEEVCLDTGGVTRGEVPIRVGDERQQPVGRDQVRAEGKVGAELAGLAEPGKDEPVARARVQHGEGVALDAAERVADVDDLVEAAADAVDGALAQLVG